MATAVLNGALQPAASGRWKVTSGTTRPMDRPPTDTFEHLYLTYRSRVWSLCLRMTGNPDEAEDLTQETFIRMFQKLDTFRGESAFYTWLRRLTINVVLLRFQKASWRRETSMEQLMGPDPITGCPHKMEFGRIDTQLTGAVDRINLQRAIDQLPPGFKAVFILHDIEGYEHIEISELMGCSVGTSKSQLHKARLRMRELLLEAAHAQSAHHGQETAGMPSTPRVRHPLTLRVHHPVHKGYATPASRAA